MSHDQNAWNHPPYTLPTPPSPPQEPKKRRPLILALKIAAGVLAAFVLIGIVGSAMKSDKPKSKTNSTAATATRQAEEQTEKPDPARETVTLAGTGENATQKVPLKGDYLVSIEYSGNKSDFNDSRGTNFISKIDSSDDTSISFGFSKSLTNDIAESGSKTKRLKNLDGTYWVEVSNASAAATWKFTFTPE
ncbi:hypothetical protein [Streptomyces indicus]|uniref:Uncharacterized protein n=1 Tax=Streptomyces indicus TaxID=417292 RepID=A0A1G8ZJA7_9ACTN|nr:hypothetical protein [Streptomyces indicus]SDK15108.1 hypothetical protein SAMN05421806_10526 [Streptomyces indicus]